MSLLDGLRLAVGTLTAVPVRPPAQVDRTTTRVAMLLAPFAVLPLGVGVSAVLWLVAQADGPALLAGFGAVAVLALGTRALHLDGLSDVADGLTASYDAERSLAVMRTGTSGPAGTAAVVLVLGAQATAFAALTSAERGWLTAGVLVCLSRAALYLTCLAGAPGARDDGLGTSYVGVVPVLVAVPGWVLITVITAGLVGPWWQGALAAVAAVLVVAALVRRTTTRFGGVTGDVFGAAIELALLTLLVGAVL